MKCVNGDLWDFLPLGYYIVVPTNSYVNTDGKAAMGRGVALQATTFFGGLAKQLGHLLKTHGPGVFVLPRQKLILFTTKNHWKDDSTLEIIKDSCVKLKAFMDKDPELKVAMPRIGCGNGKLKWEEVVELVKAYFKDFSEDRFVIVDNGQGDSRFYRGKNEEKIVGEPEEENRPLIYEPDSGIGLTYKDLLDGKNK